MRSKVLGFFDKLIDLFTGWNSRHNRALREINDLSHTIEEFVLRYKQPSDVFEHIGQARIDVTTITYEIRTRMKVAKHIRGKRLAPLVEQLNDSLEMVKNDIYTTKRGNILLDEDLSKLNSSLRTLIDSISDVGYK